MVKPQFFQVKQYNFGNLVLKTTRSCTNLYTAVLFFSEKREYCKLQPPRLLPTTVEKHKFHKQETVYANVKIYEWNDFDDSTSLALIARRRGEMPAL